jgi:hypothetical protein
MTSVPEASRITNRFKKKKQSQHQSKQDSTSPRRKQEKMSDMENQI